MRLGRSFAPALAIALVVVASTLKGGASAPPEGPPSSAPHELLVTVRPEFMPLEPRVRPAEGRFGIERMDEALQDAGIETLHKFLPSFGRATTPFGSAMERLFLLTFEDDVDVVQARDRLAAMPYFETVSLNKLLQRKYGALKQDMPTSSSFGLQWHYHDANDDAIDSDAPEAWAITRGSPDVIVAIHDSGIMVDTSGTDVGWHIYNDIEYFWTGEDRGSQEKLNGYDLNLDDITTDCDTLRDNVIGYNFSPGSNRMTTEQRAFWHAVPSDWVLPGSRDQPTGATCQVMNDHGTRVASIAGAKFEGNDTVGMASGCRYYIVRSSLTGDISKLSDEISALLHAATYADVINMSWGFLEEPGELFYSCIQHVANDSDCVLVAITGNDSAQDSVQWPARYPEVLSVGAINRDRSHAVYSNYSSSEALVDVVAPSPYTQGVYCGLHTGCETGCQCGIADSVGYSGFGTSFAAPQVTGIAALIRSRFPSMRQDSVRARIKRAAEYYWSAADSVKYGSGKVNAYRSITEWGRVHANSSHVAHWGGQRAGWPDTLYVSGDLFVAASDTLVLNRGTVICIAPDPIEHDEGDGTDPDRVEIIVRGTLRVGATGTGPVVFESFTPGAPTGSDWAGIRFEAGSRAILRNVIIRNAVEDVVVDEFDVTVADWDQTKTLYLNANHSISADRTIAVTDSLFVLGESDVIVSGGSGVDITVNGSLICKGSASRRPEFRSQSGNPYSWGVMTLASGSESHEFFNTDIRHASLAIRTYVPLTVDRCEISAGIDGIQAYDDLTVRNTIIRDMTAAGILLRAGDLDVENVTIHDCAYGIDQSTTTSTGTITCVGSHLHDLVYRGISVPFASGGVEVRRTRIERATDGIFLAYQSPATIDTCTIRLNEIGVLGFYGSSTLMRDCDLDSNVTAGYYAVAMTTTLEADTASHGAVGVFYQYGSGGSVGGNSRLTNNGVGLKCDLSSSPVVRETRISNNTDGVVALSGSSPDLGQSTGGVCGSGQDEGKNSIHANSGYHVYNATSSTLFAECNWWGGAPDSSKFYGSVDYVPYRSDDPNPAGAEGLAIGPPPPERRHALPTRYDLSPGQPNPFNPVTTIAFDVPPPGGAVRLVVYDVRGARVRVLVDGPQTAGSHAVTWNGRDEHGAPAASGVYFVQMSAPSFSQTRKVVMLK